jgi:hypothetical protein
MAAKGDVEADLVFLQRIDLYETEKPYTLQYFPDDEAFPRTNCARASRSNVRVRDLRVREKAPTVDTEGFEILQLDSAMQYADFGSTETTQHTYYPEIKALLQAHFHPQCVEILDHNVSLRRRAMFSRLICYCQIRRRHRTFPIATGTDYRDLQPTTIVHVGEKVSWKVFLASDGLQTTRRAPCVKQPTSISVYDQINSTESSR